MVIGDVQPAPSALRILPARPHRFEGSVVMNTISESPKFELITVYEQLKLNLAVVISAHSTMS